MASAVSTVAVSDLQAVLDTRIDLRELAESATGFGSYCLRWQRIALSSSVNTVGAPDPRGADTYSSQQSRTLLKTVQRLRAIA
jgi:hypothetical protein